jgi:hypothetical protein
MYNSVAFFSCQKHLPSSKFTLTHATRREPAFVNRFQICFIIAAHSILLFFSTPILHFLGTHQIPRNVALAEQSSLPFHKNRLNFCSIDLTIFSWQCILSPFLSTSTVFLLLSQRYGDIRTPFVLNPFSLQSIQ